MATPKYRTSKSKRNMRRAHHALSAPSQATCSNCGEPKRPHSICAACGHYRGKQVMEPTASDFGLSDSFDTAEA